MSKFKLLIVDDEPDLLDILEFCLEDEGLLEKIELHKAINGKEALDLAMQEDFDCILSDINMPIMNGIDFVKSVQAAGRKNPVIFLSGHGDPETLAKIDGLEIHKFIDKPFEASEVISALRAVSRKL